jgi:Fe2+ or Zn2+ uptake regulation protein
MNANNYKFSVTQIKEKILQKNSINLSKPTIYKSLDFLVQKNENVAVELDRVTAKGVFCQKFYYKKK